jgi:hypothetical protein
MLMNPSPLCGENPLYHTLKAREFSQSRLPDGFDFVKAFEEENNAFLERCTYVCASCQIRDPLDTNFCEIALADVAEGLEASNDAEEKASVPHAWLALSDQEHETYSERRGRKFDLVDDQGQRHEVSAADFDNVTAYGDFRFHLAPDEVYSQPRTKKMKNLHEKIMAADGTPEPAYFMLCGHCGSRHRKQAPKNCIAAGDFGRLRVDVGSGETARTLDLDDLNLAERLTLARARAYAVIVKVVSQHIRKSDGQRHGARSRLASSTITFSQDLVDPRGAETVAAEDETWETRYGVRAVEMALESVIPLLVGPDGAQGLLERRCFDIADLKMRPDRIFNHLQIRKHVPAVRDPRDPGLYRA